MLSFSSPGGKASLVVANSRSSHMRHVGMLTRTPSEILPRLWLSGLFTAVDEEQLAAIGVTHVVSVIEQRPLFPHAMKKLKTLHIPLQDVESADILQHLEVTTAFIRSALENKRNVVLVHCAMGISRSATVVCAYLIATTTMHPKEALQYVASKREIVCPNNGFLRQLDIYATRLRGPRRLRKSLPLPPPVRATVTYSAMMVDHGIRLLWSPETRPPPQLGPISRRGSMS